ACSTAGAKSLTSATPIGPSRPVSVLRWGGVTTVSDSATDRPEFRRAINEAIGWGDRKEVADVYQEHGGRFTDDPTPYEALLAVAQWGAETALTYADHDG